MTTSTSRSWTAWRLSLIHIYAGDGKSGPGNATSIGVEICVNAGGDFEAAKANAAALVRLLMEEHGIHIDHVVQHLSLIHI